MADTDRNEEFINEIRKQLGDYRFIHSLNVAKTAVELARRYGTDEKKAYTAGVLHDVLKDKSPEPVLPSMVLKADKCLSIGGPRNVDSITSSV